MAARTTGGYGVCSGCGAVTDVVAAVEEVSIVEVVGAVVTAIAESRKRVLLPRIKIRDILETSFFVW